MISFFIATGITRLIVRDKQKKVYYCNNITSYLSRYALKALAINLRVKNEDNSFKNNQNYLILSNHLSYIDIFVLFSYFSAAFVASIDEVQQNIILGKATEYSGGIFVERRNRSNIKQELDSISETIERGLNVVLYPEGTTSNGDQVLPFKSSFLAVAERSDIEILPVCIKYKKINNSNINSENRDLIYYYGGMKFFPHFFRFLEVKSIDVELRILDVINSADHPSRKEISSLSYQAINNAYLET